MIATLSNCLAGAGNGALCRADGRRVASGTPQIVRWVSRYFRLAASEPIAHRELGSPRQAARGGTAEQRRRDDADVARSGDGVKRGAKVQRTRPTLWRLP